jgi:hypothetical protein
MEKMIPGLDILLNRDEESFVVINNCVHPKLGCSTEYGSLVRMTRQEMEQDGLAVVLRSLEEYPRRQKTEKSELESLPRAAQDKFDRDHKHVSLSLQKGAELWLAPMHVGKRGGKISGDMSETQIVKLPATPDVFFKALTAAFAAAD